VRIYCFKITKWNSETKLDLRMYFAITCLFHAFLQRQYFLFITQSRATFPVVSSSVRNFECASELDIFRLVLFEHSNIYSLFSRMDGSIFMQWVV